MSNQTSKGQEGISEKIMDLLVQLQKAGVSLEEVQYIGTSLDVLKERSLLSKTTLDNTDSADFASWPEWDDTWTNTW